MFTHFAFEINHKKYKCNDNNNREIFHNFYDVYQEYFYICEYANVEWIHGKKCAIC